MKNSEMQCYSRLIDMHRMPYQIQTYRRRLRLKTGTVLNIFSTERNISYKLFAYDYIQNNIYVTSKRNNLPQLHADIINPQD